MKVPTVVHLNKEKYDILIDRRSKWGNPYKLGMIITETEANILGDPKFIGTKINRDNCLILFENYIENNSDLLNSLQELDGKILGCWCKPKKCHGDVIIEMFKKHVLLKDTLEYE